MIKHVSFLEFFKVLNKMGTFHFSFKMETAGMVKKYFSASQQCLQIRSNL